MPYELATSGIQAAMVELLEADAVLTSILTTKPSARGGGPAIWNDGEAPQTVDAARFPYMTVGLWTQIPDHSFSPESSGQSGYGWNCTGQFKAIGQRQVDVNNVISAMLSVLFHGRRIVVSGYDSGWVDEANVQPMLKSQLAGVTVYELPVIIRARVHDG